MTGKKHSEKENEKIGRIYLSDQFNLDKLKKRYDLHKNRIETNKTTAKSTPNRQQESAATYGQFYPIDEVVAYYEKDFSFTSATMERLCALSINETDLSGKFSENEMSEINMLFSLMLLTGKSGHKPVDEIVREMNESTDYSTNNVSK